MICPHFCETRGFAESMFIEDQPVALTALNSDKFHATEIIKIALITLSITVLVHLNAGGHMAHVTDACHMCFPTPMAKLRRYRVYHSLGRRQTEMNRSPS